MSKTTIALEAAVAAVLDQMPKGDGVSSARQRAAVDKAFGTILKLIAPRIRHFIRQYGLVAHWEDAEQCCAIAVHRAIVGYDPAKAQFTTFVNWQIRGELQSLRFRMMTDQRPSAKKVDATTVSLHAMTSNSDGEEASLESILEDSGALARTEAGASDYLAQAATASLIEEYIDHQRVAAIDRLRKRPGPKRTPRAEPVDHALAVPRRLRSHGVCPIELEKLEQKLERDKEIVERRVFDVTTLDELGSDTGVTKERVRQITKRASRAIAELARDHPRFAVMGDYRRPSGAGPRMRNRATAAANPATVQVPPSPILPAIGQPHNTLSSLVAINATAGVSIESLRPEDGGSNLATDAMLGETSRRDGNAPGSQARH